MTDTTRLVLVVDDDDIVRRVVRAMLEADNFEVVEARDGNEALERVGAGHPMGGVRGLMMPGFAGVEDVRALAFVVEAKDAYTGQHLERCRVYGMALMEALGIAADYPDAEYGFLLHDSGKVGIPERILNKPGPLTAAEWRVMRTHPLIGYQMVAGIPFLTTAAQIVRGHHEMFDGSGYPEGLKREGIPLPAR